MTTIHIDPDSDHELVLRIPRSDVRELRWHHDPAAGGRAVRLVVLRTGTEIEVDRGTFEALWRAMFERPEG